MNFQRVSFNSLSCCLSYGLVNIFKMMFHGVFLGDNIVFVNETKRGVDAKLEILWEDLESKVSKINRYKIECKLNNNRSTSSEFNVNILNVNSITIEVVLKAKKLRPKTIRYQKVSIFIIV